MSDRGKGAFAAVMAALLAAAFYIPFKAAGEGNSRTAVVMAMLGCAALLNTVTWLIRGSGGLALRRVALITAVGLAVFTVLGNIGLASALAVQEPAVTATIVHTQLLFVAVLEWIALKHPITWRFVVGAAIAVAGFAAMQLDGAGFDSASTAGVLWALLASASFAVMHVITRAVIKRIDPVSVNAIRLWLSVAALACFPGSATAAFELDASGWALAFTAAFLGPFLSRLCLMLAVRFIPASEASLITMSNPLFAFVLGFAFFGTLPGGIQSLAALVILAGVLLPMWPTGAATQAADRSADRSTDRSGREP